MGYCSNNVALSRIVWLVDAEVARRGGQRINLARHELTDTVAALVVVGVKAFQIVHAQLLLKLAVE